MELSRLLSVGISGIWVLPVTGGPVTLVPPESKRSPKPPPPQAASPKARPATARTTQLIAFRKVQRDSPENGAGTWQR